MSSASHDRLARARELLGAGASADALRVVSDAVRIGSLSADEITAAGQLISRALQGSQGVPGAPVVTILGQVTTSLLAFATSAIIAGHGVWCRIRQGGYDTVLQDAIRASGDQAATSAVLVMLPWTQRFLDSSDLGTDDLIAREVRYWRGVWDAAQAGGVTRLVQVGYDWVGPGAEGYQRATQPGGTIDCIRTLNNELRRALPGGHVFLPLSEISGVVGRAGFYDLRSYYWTKDPFSTLGRVELATHIAAALRSIMTGPRKLLVLDLDNTLWGGTLGEDGVHGIIIGNGPDGEAFAAFQGYLLALRQRGVILAVCSKNELADVRAVFEQNGEMILRFTDFAAVECSWEPKSSCIVRLAEKLRLGLDSVVFFDDNPAERDLVRKALPDVGVVEVPDEPAEFARVVERGLWFESPTLTWEDSTRGALYATNRDREMARALHVDLDEYLRSLEMEGDVRALEEPDIRRVAQLLSRTNQFNATGWRPGEEQVRALLLRRDVIARTLRLRDRFGDYGLIGVAIASLRPESDTLSIDTLALSCRAIARTAEHFLVAEVFAEARSLGAHTAEIGYVSTPRNAVARDALLGIGFVATAAPHGGREILRRDLSAEKLSTPIRLARLP